MQLSRQSTTRFHAVSGFILLGLVALTAPAQTYRISTIAKLGSNGDGGAARQATLLFPRGIAVARDGTIYVSENPENRIRRIAPNGIITTYAGTGVAGINGDDGPAIQASLNAPTDLALDSKGNLYVLDSNNARVRKITPDGMIHTVAGNGQFCGVSVEGPATNLGFCTLADLTLDTAGNLYLSEEDAGQSGGHRVWRVDSSGNATVVAGPQDGLQAPTLIAVDNAGNLYISDLVYLYRKPPGGVIENIAGAYSGIPRAGGQAKGNPINAPTALTIGPDNNLYFASGFGFEASAVYTIRSGIIQLVTGVDMLNSGGFDGDNGIKLNQPGGLSFDAAGNLFISDYGNHRIRKLSANNALSTVAGTRTLPSGSIAPLFQFGAAVALAVGSDDSLYFADYVMAQVRRIGPDGRVGAFAGSGVTDYSGDDGPATSAGLGESLNTLGFDSGGNLYLDSYSSYRIRQVTASGVIHTLIGNGVLNQPLGDVKSLAADSPGLIYYADSFGLHHYFQGSSSLLTNLSGISSVAVSPSGVLHFLAAGQVSRFQNGQATVIAGGSKPATDGMPAVNAQLGFPNVITFDHAGNLYIAGTRTYHGPGVVWRVTPDGILHSIAGPVSGAESPDGTPALSAAFPAVSGIAVESSGIIYLALGPEIRALIPDAGSGCSISASTSSFDALAEGGKFDVSLKASSFLCPYSVQSSATWIVPSVSGGAGSGTVTLNVEANTGAARQAAASIGPVTITIRQAGAAIGSSVAITAVVNAASGNAATVAPGEIVVIYGSGLGPAALAGLVLNSVGLVDTQLAGTSAFFDGIPAPLIYSSNSQIGAVVPYEVSNAQPQVTVQYQGQVSAAFSTTLAGAAPGLFTADSSGAGQVAALNEDGSYNGPDTPAAAGSVVTMYATGEGQTSPGGVDGKLASEPYPKPVAAVVVKIGGQTAEILYQGGAPGEVAGVLQLDVRIPTGLAAGSIPVVLQVGDVSSPVNVTLSVR